MAVAALGFAAHLAYYPSCLVSYLEGDTVTDKPIRIFHGGADDVTPVASCRRWVGRLRQAGRDAELVEYPGAQHGLDIPGGITRRLDRPGENACVVEEVPGGRIVNRETRRPFTLSDACLSRGVTFGHDPAADAASVKAVRAFLGSVFGLGSR